MLLFLLIKNKKNKELLFYFIIIIAGELMPCLGSMQRSAFYKWNPLQKTKMLREIATPIHAYFSSTSLKPEQQKKLNWLVMAK